MAYNVTSLTAQVQSKLDDSGFNATTILQYLNDTQREVFNSRTFRFLEAVTTFTATPGVASIGTMPSDFQLAISMRITSPVNYATDLEYIDFKEFDAENPAQSLNGNGPSTVWYDYTGQIYVGNAFPDRAYTYTLKYYKKVPELTVGSDIPSVPEEFQELLVLGAYARALDFNDNNDQAQYIKDGQFKKLLTDMTKRFSARKSGGYQMPINRRRNRTT